MTSQANQPGGQVNEPIPVGTRLENYRIVRLLASGGFSFVYLAHDENEMPVAIKEYLPSTLALRANGESYPRIPEQDLATFRVGMKSFFEEGRAPGVSRGGHEAAADLHAGIRLARAARRSRAARSLERHLLRRRHHVCLPGQRAAAACRSAPERRQAGAGAARLGGKVFPRAARNGGLVPAAAPPRPAAERVRAAEGPALMKFSIVSDSRRGMRRVNEDRVGHWQSPGALLMAVADGLGGHLHGEIAAHLAIDCFGAEFLREARPELADPARFLSRTMAAAHEAIVRHTEKLQLSDMPRTVLVACVVQDGYAHWSNVGDCRLYLLREGRVRARTRDDTLVQLLVDEGRIREEAMASHPERNRLLQTLGGYQTPRPAGASARLAKDDVLLLCSDGFWGPLTQRQLVHGFIANPDR